MDLINNNDTLLQIINRAESAIVTRKYPFVEEIVNCLENNEKCMRDIIKEKCEIPGDKHILFKFVMLYYTFLIENPNISKEEIISKMNAVICDSDLRMTLMKLRLVSG